MTRAFLLAALSLAALSAPATAQQVQPQQQPPEVTRPIEEMSRQELRDAVTLLRRYYVNGGVRPYEPTQGCTSPESRQWDFWVGEWQLLPTRQGGDVSVAESTISLVDQGCVIIERYRPYTGQEGMSVNIYDAVTQSWHQTYVAALGRRVTYEGRFDDAGVLRMDVTSPPIPGGPQRQRMNFQRIDDNSLRQWGETFDPATNAWTVSFDFTYRRRPGSAPAR